MPGITGLASTNNYPNFLGRMYHVTPADSPLIRMINGLQGGGTPLFSHEWSWQTDDNPAADATAGARLEGADATFAERTPAEVEQTCTIFHEGIHISYSRQSGLDYVGTTAADAGSQWVGGPQPVRNPFQRQIDLKLRKIARDLAAASWNATFSNPADRTSTAPSMRGLLPSITTTNVAGGAATLTKVMVDSLVKGIVDNGGELLEPVLFVGSHQKQVLSSIYGYAPESRNVGGVNINQIETDFAVLGVAYDRFIPADDIALLDLAYVDMRWRAINDLNGNFKGFLFFEPLAKTGSFEKGQLYGEAGIEYGPEQYHGKITNLATS